MAARLDEADDDGDGREQQDAGKLCDDGAVRAHHARTAAGGDGMGNLMQAESREHAELLGREAEDGLEADLDEREDRAEDCDDGDGEHGLVRL